MDISRFQSSISQKGVLPTNRFRIQFALPPYLREVVLQNLFDKFIDEQITELVTLRCEAASFPGMNMTLMEQPRIGYGPLEFMPHNAVLSDVQLTFLVDAFGDVHRLFYEWHNRMVNISGSKGQSRLSGTEGSRYAPFEVGYKSDYSTDIQIFVYDRDSETQPVMQAKIYKAFPTDLPSIPLSWNSNDELIRLTIPFKYTDFDIEYSKPGISFGSNLALDQATAPVEPTQSVFQNAIVRTALTNPITAGAVAGIALVNSIRDRFTD
jgi:hypothetical protein